MAINNEKLLIIETPASIGVKHYLIGGLSCSWTRTVKQMLAKVEVEEKMQIRAVILHTLFVHVPRSKTQPVCTEKSAFFRRPQLFQVLLCARFCVRKVELAKKLGSRKNANSFSKTARAVSMCV